MSNALMMSHSCACIMRSCGDVLQRPTLNELRAEVGSLMAKATPEDLRVATHLIEYEYAKIISGAPPVPVNTSVKFELARRISTFVLPLLMIGFAVYLLGNYGWLSVLLAYPWHKSLDTNLSLKILRAKQNPANSYADSMISLARSLAVPVEKITGALLAEMHKKYWPIRAKELKQQAERKANRARLGMDGGRPTYVPAFLPDGESGGGGHYDDPVAMPGIQSPAFNVNGQPMVPGSWVDIDGKHFGQM